MLLNMNFSKSVNTIIKDDSWIKSPADGVFRLPLEKEHAESGHTTSFVKFESGSYFPHHEHPKGEELYVLEGVFSDESGDYPAGTYIRNPPGSRHKPFTESGCTLFVKLDQFKEGDNERLVIKPEEIKWQQGIGNLKVFLLHQYINESTALVWWPKKEVFQPHSHFGGEEIVIIKGKFIDEHGEHKEGSWLRSPHLSEHFPYVDEETLILVKVGHLPII
jgi:anti-sigma factor ChrR (cupin superfamily)